MDELITCINGDFLPSHQAMLPVSDRGWRFGDGVFETIRLHQGVPYQWEAHESRLLSGLNALRIAPPSADLKAVARELLQRNRAMSGSLRISISRGVGSRGYLPLFAKANWVMEILPAIDLPAGPLGLWVSNYRRIPLESMPMNEKLAQGVGSTLALMEAQDHDCDDALQLSATGAIACAASGNIGWVKGKQIFTPALTTGCLRGTTRARLMELSTQPFHECTETLETLHTADAVFICNSRLGVWPVSSIHSMDICFPNEHPTIGKLQNLILSDRKQCSQDNHLYWLNK